VPRSHFGTSSADVPLLHQTVYIAVTAFVINLVVSVVFTLIFRAARVPDGRDETKPAHYVADYGPEEAREPAATAGSASASS
jgi:SSS family solute:Na+ symporter